MNKKKWDSLSKIDQEAITSVSRIELAKLAGKAWDNADREGITISKQNGVKITQLSESDKKLVKKILSPIIEETLKKIEREKNIDAHKIYSLLLEEIKSLENY